MDLAALHAIAKRMTRKQWCQLWVDFAEGRDVAVELPGLPAEAIQKITNNLSGRATMIGAAQFYQIADEEISARFADPSLCRLLDYGAGWGRITRLMLRSIHPANLYAVDVDHRLVESGTAILFPVSFGLIQSGETLPFDDESLDIVISNSVFTHLSQSAHMFYIAEIERILRPRGLFLGTTLGGRHFDAWLASDQTRRWITRTVGDAETVRRRLAAGEFVFGPTGRWPDYGITLLPPGWVAANWPPELPVVSARTDYSQDVHIAVKN